MSDLTPKQLKAIAEGMGFNAAVSGATCYVIKSPDLSPIIYGIPYKPDAADDAQMVKIMEKLKIAVQPLVNPDAWQGIINPHSMAGYAAEIFEEGKTINEAVCNAAFKYFKGE